MGFFPLEASFGSREPRGYPGLFPGREAPPGTQPRARFPCIWKPTRRGSSARALSFPRGGFSPSKATRATKAPRRRKLSSSRHRLRRRRPQPIDAVLAPPRSTPSSLPAAAAILEPRRRRRHHRHLAAASTAFLASSPLPLPRYATAAVPLAVNT